MKIEIQTPHQGLNRWDVVGGYMKKFKVPSSTDLEHGFPQGPYTPMEVAHIVTEEQGLDYDLATNSYVRSASVAPMHTIYTLEGDSVFEVGLIQEVALDRLKACKAGEVFRYRNKPLRKLTDQELKNFLDGKVFQWTMEEPLWKLL